jgi:hypothetical protein
LTISARSFFILLIACGSSLARFVFSPAEWTGGLVVAEFLNGIVLGTIVEHRTIVGAGYDHGFFGTPETLDGLHHLADGPVEFKIAVAARSHPAFADETFVRRARHVDVMGGERKTAGSWDFMESRRRGPDHVAGETLRICRRCADL